MTVHLRKTYWKSEQKRFECRSFEANITMKTIKSTLRVATVFIFLLCIVNGTESGLQGNPKCTASRRGTFSCSFSSADYFCGGVFSGYGDCSEVWVLSANTTGNIHSGFVYDDDEERGYTYLHISEEQGKPCALESEVEMDKVDSVCIEFQYATSGTAKHGVSIGLLTNADDFVKPTNLFSLDPTNTNGKWHKVGASCCLRASGTHGYITFSVENATSTSSVALDQLDIKVADRTCEADEPTCLVYELDLPSEQLQIEKQLPRDSLKHCDFDTESSCGLHLAGWQWSDQNMSSLVIDDSGYVFAVFNTSTGVNSLSIDVVEDSPSTTATISFWFASTGNHNHKLVIYLVDLTSESYYLLEKVDVATNGQWKINTLSLCLPGKGNTTITFHASAITEVSTVALDSIDIRYSSVACETNMTVTEAPADILLKEQPSHGINCSFDNDLCGRTQFRDDPEGLIWEQSKNDSNISTTPAPYQGTSSKGDKLGTDSTSPRDDFVKEGEVIPTPSTLKEEKKIKNEVLSPSGDGDNREADGSTSTGQEGIGLIIGVVGVVIMLVTVVGATLVIVELRRRKAQKEAGPAEVIDDQYSAGEPATFGANYFHNA